MYITTWLLMYMYDTTCGTHLTEDFEEGGFSHVLGEIAHVQRSGVVRGDLNNGKHETAAAGKTR